MSRPLKIFSISKNDWAGCGYFLSEAVNECTEHHSRAMRIEPSVFEFPYDLTGLRGQQIKRLYDWADVVHIHDAGGDPKIRKPTVITHHGTKFRKAPKSYIKQAVMSGRLCTVATPDLTMFGPPILPDCRPDLSEYRDLPSEFTVCHAPTKRVVKGTAKVIRACKRLGVKLDLIEGVSWQECLERKGRTHLLVDQFELGYGANAIEAWSMGIPVISDGTDDVISAIESQYQYTPFVQPISTLENTIAMLRDDRNEWGSAAAKGYTHYLTYHSYAAASKLAVWVYEQVIEKYQSRMSSAKMPPKMKFGLGNVVLLRYLGGNVGKNTWMPLGGTGTHYKFSALTPEHYVYDPDVEWFLEQETKAGTPMFERVG